MEPPAKTNESIHVENQPIETIESVPEKGPGEMVDLMVIDTERAPEARGHDLNALPRSYWFSSQFIGSYLAVGFAFTAGIGSYGMAAPLLTNINEDIGPDPNISWFPTAWILTQGIGNLIAGRVSDIFGRRWVFIMGSVLGLIGSIIAATAQSVGALIGASVILGLGGGIQISWFWAISELVPMKWRYLANSGAYIIAFPTSPLAPKLAYEFQHHTSVKWRGCFYLMIACNVVSVALWYIFYHPPTFKMLHRRKALKEMLISFDWIGLALYTAAAWTFLMGIGWGGSRYPWKSAPVIASILSGAAGFALLLLWEAYLPFKDTYPFLPLHMLRNGGLMIVTVLSGIGASVYYGTSVIWPNAVTNLYSDRGDLGTLFCVVLVCYTGGQIIGGLLATVIGSKRGICVTMMIAGPFLAAAGANPLSYGTTLGLILPGALTVGVMEGIALANTSFPLKTQEEIGTAGGVAGTLRLLISNTAVSVFTTTLNNRLATTVPANVIPAAIKAGLAASAIPSLISGLSGTTPLDPQHVPGLNQHVLQAATAAWKTANAQAYRTVFLVTLAFSGPGMLLCWFMKKDDQTKDNFVVQHIHHTSDEKRLEEEEG